jgi:hypothetical protein
MRPGRAESLLSASGATVFIAVGDGGTEMNPNSGTRTPETSESAEAEKGRSREAELDEALAETFPASDPVAVGHSDHAGVPPSHQPSADEPRGGRRKGS